TKRQMQAQIGLGRSISSWEISRRRYKIVTVQFADITPTNALSDKSAGTALLFPIRRTGCPPAPADSTRLRRHFPRRRRCFSNRHCPLRTGLCILSRGLMTNLSDAANEFFLGLF